MSVDYRKVHDQVASLSPSVSLMAVSKTHAYEAVLEAYGQGARLFGENRVQEAASKFPEPSRRPEGMKLCLIGHLQRNKAKRALEVFDRIDSVDSLALMDELETRLAQLGRTFPILFELRSSGEQQKTGFADEEALMEAVAHLEACPHLILRGLMTVGPLDGGGEGTRMAFRRTKALYDRLVAQGLELSVLSMGMSGDWTLAIEEGSNEVRIGTAIFGARNYNA